MRRGTFQKVAFAAILISLLMVPAGRADATDALLLKARALRSNLVARGFGVLGELSYSRFPTVSPVDIYCRGEVDTCNANNKASYHVAAVPELTGQAETASSLQFRIRRNEAVVLVGQTPPPCDFFSYVCYQYSRYEEGWGPKDVHKIFSAFGDPVNRFVLNPVGNNFNKNVVIVFTADQDTNNAVRKAAIDAGFPQEVLNTSVIPSSLLRTNQDLDKTTDQLLILQRTTLWRDGSSDGNGYMKNARVVVFRVTPPDASHTPIPTPRQRVRGTGRTEFDYTPAVDLLREMILQRHSNLSAQEFTTNQWLVQSPIALQTNTNTLADSSDTVYLRTEESFKLSDSPDDFLIAYGVDHHRANKAIYHNVTVYTQLKECGMASAFDHCNGNPNCVAFAGSAWDYLQIPQADKLYALKIARHCNGERNCLEVPVGRCTEGIGLNDDMFVGYRAYVEPKTKVGPSYTELLFDRVIHFTSIPAPSLVIDKKIFESSYPEPAVISFGVTPASRNVSWEANIEFVDDMDCGTITPDHGNIRVQDGNSEASFEFKARHPGAYYLTITIKDQQARSSTTEVKVVVNP